MSLGLPEHDYRSLGIRGHDACWHECDKVLSALKEEIKSEARKLKKDGLPIEKIFLTLHNLVPKKGWTDFDKRLKQLFLDDADPLNVTRRKMTSFFYAAHRVNFNVHFKQEIEAILKGEEIPQKKEAAPIDFDEESDTETADLEAKNQSEKETTSGDSSEVNNQRD